MPRNWHNGAMTTLKNSSLVCLLISLLSACGSGDSLDAIRDSGKLTVISRNSPATFYHDKNGASGYDYTLAKLFAKRLGVELEMRTAYSYEEISEQLKRRDVDIAAAGLTVEGATLRGLDTSTPYRNSVSQLVYRTGTFRPRSVDQLADKSLVATKSSPQLRMLDALHQKAGIEFAVEATEEFDVDTLLTMVREQQVSFGVLDSNDFDFKKSLYPRLRVAFELGGVQEHAWWLPPGNKHAALKNEINTFFAELKNNGTLERLHERFFGHNQGIDQVDSQTFARAVEKKLPKYIDLMKQVATEYQMDWRLLAAVSYQESHWNPLAKSPTGVRGMMMLTRPTAKELGVDNRLNAKQSLRGGVRYLNSIKRRLPETIQDEDRIWFALAAYNVGLGHLRDARTLTERQGGNPDRWVDVEKRLPLLRQKKYYKTVKFGYTRGNEPVTYVNNIRHYYNILKWQELPEQQPLPPVNAQVLLPDVLQNVALRGI